MNAKELGAHDVTAGITKRELFAAMAMQGLMGKVENVNDVKALGFVALAAADSLLAELSEEQN